MATGGVAENLGTGAAEGCLFGFDGAWPLCRFAASVYGRGLRLFWNEEQFGVAIGRRKRSGAPFRRRCDDVVADVKVKSFFLRGKH